MAGRIHRKDVQELHAQLLGLAEQNRELARDAAVQAMHNESFDGRRESIASTAASATYLDVAGLLAKLLNQETL